MNFVVTDYDEGGWYEAAYPTSIDPKNDPFIKIEAFQDGYVIGDMVLCRTKYGFYETHSTVYDPGKGIGNQMYAHAIQEALDRGLEVRSSRVSTQSKYARWLWKSKRLRKRFRILRKGNRFQVICGENYET